MNERARTGLLLVGLIALGVALRLFRLGEVPFGFHPDEGHNALDALRIAGGWRPVFLPGNNGREPLFMYLMAGTLSLFGPSIWSARLAGVIAGALVIWAQYLFVRALPLPHPRFTALISAALVAVTFWPVAQARYALRANLLPAWVALALWAWWRAVTGKAGEPRSRGAWALIAGVFLAAALYTHLVGRLLPVVLVGSALWMAGREGRGEPIVLLVMALAVAGALALPQVFYFRDNPALLSYRVDQVSVLNPEVNRGNLAGTLAENAWDLLRMANLRGDTSWYHNLEGRPVFDPLVGLAFLAGLALLASDLAGQRGRSAQAAGLLLVLALAVMLMPSWLSVGAPNYVRLTGTWPVLFLLPAWGFERGAAWLDKRSRPGAGTAAVMVVLAASAAWAMGDYFVRYAPTPQAYRAFNAAAVERGRHVAALVDEGPMYVSPAIWKQSVIRFLNIEDPPGSFDPRFGLVLPPAGDAQYAFDPVELEDALAFGGRWPQAVRFEIYNSRGELSLIVYVLSREKWPVTHRPFDYAFGDWIRLQAAEVEPSTVVPGGRLTVMLEWLAVAPTDVDMNFFVHLVVEGERKIGQFDGPPLGGSHLTNRWVPGERIFQQVEIPVAEDASPGPALLRTGWYDWRTGARLPVAGDDDAAVEIGWIEVTQRGHGH